MVVWKFGPTQRVNCGRSRRCVSMPAARGLDCRSGLSHAALVDRHDAADACDRPFRAGHRRPAEGEPPAGARGLHQALRDRTGARAAAARHFRGEDFRQGRGGRAPRARGSRMRDCAARQRRHRQGGDRGIALDPGGAAQGGARPQSVFRARRGVSSRPRERGRLHLCVEGDRGCQGADGSRALPQPAACDAGPAPDQAASGDPRCGRGRARPRPPSRR